MTTACLRVAQWVPLELPLVGDSIQVIDLDPVETDYAATAFPEAPLDTKLYGRKDAAWNEIVIPASGVVDAPSDGKSYVRKDAAWADGDAAFATDADLGGKVSKAGDTMTGALKLADGSVGAPALSYGSEPGMGLFRGNTGTQGVAVGGALVAALGAQSLTQTYSSLNSRAAGVSFFQAVNAPAVAVNYNSLSFGVDQTHGFLNSTKGGSNTDKPLDFIGAGAYTFDNAIYGFAKTAGGESNLVLMNQPVGVANYQRLQLGATAGGVVLYGAGFGGAAKPVMYFDAASFSFTGGGITAPAFGAPLFNLTGGAATNWVQDVNNVYFQMAPSWYWVYGKASGTLMWQHGGGPASQFINNGDFQAGRNVLAAGGALGLISSGGQAYVRFTSDGWRLEYGGGHLYWNNPSNTNLFRVQSDGNLVLPIGKGYQVGGGTWVDISDERTKDNIADYATGLDEILALRPRTYNFKPETGRNTETTYTGLIAQECEVPMPEMVTAAPGTVGTLSFDDMRTLDTSALIYALVNAVRTLHTRLGIMERASVPLPEGKA